MNCRCTNWNYRWRYVWIIDALKLIADAEIWIINTLELYINENCKCFEMNYACTDVWMECKSLDKRSDVEHCKVIRLNFWLFWSREIFLGHQRLKLFFVNFLVFPALQSNIWSGVVLFFFFLKHRLNFMLSINTSHGNCLIAFRGIFSN